MQELLRIAPVIDDLGNLFSDAGHEIYLVGGSVRDALLGVLGHDLDFTTSASPDQTEALLKQFTPTGKTYTHVLEELAARVVAASAAQLRGRTVEQTCWPRWALRHRHVDEGGRRDAVRVHDRGREAARAHPRAHLDRASSPDG